MDIYRRYYVKLHQYMFRFTSLPLKKVNIDYHRLLRVYLSCSLFIWTKRYHHSMCSTWLMGIQKIKMMNCIKIFLVFLFLVLRQRLFTLVCLKYFTLLTSIFLFIFSLFPKPYQGFAFTPIHSRCQPIQTNYKESYSLPKNTY